MPDGCTSLKQDNGKWKCYDKFEVQKIIIENKKIVALAIRNARTRQNVYQWQDPVWQKKRESQQ
jgi:hypothetical protein